VSLFERRNGEPNGGSQVTEKGGGLPKVGTREGGGGDTEEIEQFRPKKNGGTSGSLAQGGTKATIKQVRELTRQRERGKLWLDKVEDEMKTKIRKVRSRRELKRSKEKSGRGRKNTKTSQGLARRLVKMGGSNSGHYKRRPPLQKTLPRAKKAPKWGRGCGETMGISVQVGGWWKKIVGGEVGIGGNRPRQNYEDKGCRFQKLTGGEIGN